MLFAVWRAAVTATEKRKMNMVCRKLALLAVACIGMELGAAGNTDGGNGVVGGASCALAPQVMNHVDKRLCDNLWGAYWIGVPNENPREYGVRLFRKKVSLSPQELGDSFIVHVSADERYKLYVNGREVSNGPARGDQFNWKFETVDLRPYLREGDNVLCATVWFFGTARPVAQMTYGECGFLMQGDTPREDIVNTGGSWRCMTNHAYSICREGRVRGYFCVGPNEQVDMDKYPHGWLGEDFDDSGWKQAYGQFRAAMRGYPDYGFRLLTLRSIPQMERTPCRPLVVRQLQTGSDTVFFPMDTVEYFGGTVVPEHSRMAILLDQLELVTGYLNLSLSGGKGAVVTVGYAETLFTGQPDGNLLPLGNRNEIEDKVFLGCKDRILCDGTEGFCFTPLWWRTWRYVLLEIETGDESLRIDSLGGVTSMYPFERVSTLSADGDPDLAGILDVGWRTARLCANETYMDCPYYEQLQYFGDTRIQAMVTMFSTRDSLMLRQALEMGQQSMVAEGLTRSRFPSSFMQVISSYSLSWSGMVYDYWMYRDDPGEVKRLLPSVRRILAWYEQYLRPDGSLEKIPFWFFCDWADGFDYGVPPRRADGYSAYQDLALLMALDEAAAMEHALGIEGMALHYEDLAGRIRCHFVEHYWDSARQLFADTRDKCSFSQHTNIMAVICGILPPGQDTELCRRILDDKSLTQATIYFRYYLFAAMKKAGLADRFLDELGIWRHQLGEGMTTWAETPAPTRSDCHAWGASPNVELFRCILGISSQAPGFSKIRIEPSLGKLRRISGSMPHPKGTISVSLEILPSGKLRRAISVPQGVECEFVWRGKTEIVK